MHLETFSLVVVVGFSACHRPEVEPAVPPRRVRCAPTTIGRAVEQLSLRGTVSPRLDRDANVSSQVSGTVASLEVREGERVLKGQVLARIDRGVLSDVVLQAEAAQSRAHAERVNAEATLERARGVFSRGISARQDLDDAVARAAAAQATETTADSALNQAQRQLGRAVVRAPFDGVVIRIFKKPGELVDGSPSMPVAEVADVEQLELTADAPANQLVRTAVGQPARVVISALGPASIAAQVSTVAPSVDRGTGLGTLRVALTPRDLQVPLGATATVLIELAVRESAVWVPAQALRNHLGTTAQVIECGPIARVLAVEPGMRHDGLVEVVGVDAGIEVVTEGLLGIKEGEPLEVQR